MFELSRTDLHINSAGFRTEASLLFDNHRDISGARELRSYKIYRGRASHITDSPFWDQRPESDD